MTSNRLHPRLRRAFSIVEVVMSMFILTFALSTSVTTLQRAFINLDTARNITSAALIMQTEFEKERLLTFAEVSISYQPAIDPLYTGNPTLAGRFILTRTVTTNVASKLVEVTLSVTWTNYDRTTRTRSLSTYFADGGINDYLFSAN